MDLYDIYNQLSDKENITFEQFSSLKRSTYLEYVCDKGHEYTNTIGKRISGRNCPYCSGNKILPGFNDLSTREPQLIKEWDFSKNDKSPDTIFPGTKKKYWWLCPKGHSYDMAPIHRKYGQGCPYCSGKRVLIGFNDLLSQYNELCKEWDYNKNDISPDEFVINSAKRVWWKCKEGHEWKSKIYNRTTNNSNCPYCVYEEKENVEYIDKNSSEFKENIIPYLIENKFLEKSISKNRILKFKCKKGHRYNREAYTQLKNTKCPICFKKSRNEKLLKYRKYWDYSKNKENITDINISFKKKYWWVCDKNHSYLMSIDKKINRSNNCPYCSNRKVLIGYNDITTTHPELLKEWNYDKNTIKPDEVTYGSDKKVWWKCEKGHEWKTSLNQRTYEKRKTNCPYCYTPVFVSRGEQEVYDYVKNILPKKTTIIQSDRTILYPKELDIYIPDYNLAIEYNGAYWHKESELRDKYYHYNKWKNCNDNNINLITIWDYQWNNDNTKTIIKNILQQKLNVAQDIISDNIQVMKITKNQAKKFCNLYHLKGFSDGDYFNGVKNKDTGELIAVGVWNYNNDILYLEQYCSYTVNNNELKLLLDNVLQFNNDIRKVVAFSDLENSDNEMLEELGFQQECLIDPEYGFLYKKKLLNEKDFTIKLFKKDKELEYQEGLSIIELLELNDIPQVYNSGSFKYVHTISDTCLSQKDAVDRNTKEIVDEDKKFELNILNKWDYEKNDSDPTKIKRGSHKNFWFLCDKGHFYYKEFRQQYKNGKCVYCSNVKVLAGFNDIATTHPELVEEWNYDKNDCYPQEFTFGSSKKVWWKCDYGHEWEETINQRTSPKRNYNCPYCSNHRVSSNNCFNDEILLKQWDYDKNVITPQELTSGSRTKIHWKCEKGHKWVAALKDRTRSDNKNTNCPKCTATISRGEQEVYDYVKSILPENTTIIQSDKTILYPKELDIYIPEYNIAIEYNGVYWHKESELRDKYYHYNKWLKCNENDIQLITIWDVNWQQEDKKSIIKSLLKHKLGVSTQKKIFARNTILTSISNSSAREFCNINHIQGFSNGSYYNGLKDKTTGELVAVGIWRKNKDTLYLDRYCTNHIVVGGMGKLLKDGINYAKNNGLKEIVTFADLEVSDGSLYEKLGFIRDKILAPDYKYLYDDELKHKFGFRLNRFRNDPLLEYKDGLTEWELAELNDIPRIYDSGKIRYKISV